MSGVAKATPFLFGSEFLRSWTLVEVRLNSPHAYTKRSTSFLEFGGSVDLY